MNVEGTTNKHAEMKVFQNASSPEKTTNTNEIAKTNRTTKTTIQPQEKIQFNKWESPLDGTELKEGVTEEQEKKVVAAIEQANKHFRTFDRRLEFSIHEATKEIMVKVINTEDDKIIREIPSEKVLDMVAHMWELAGILVDEKI